MEISADLTQKKNISISLVLIIHFVFIVLFYISFEIALAQGTSNQSTLIDAISNQVPTVTAKIGCANATNIPTAYFDANGFPPNIQLGISLINNNNNPNIQDPHIVFPDVPSHVLTDNSGSWSGMFNYYIRFGGDPSDNDGNYKYSVSIFVDKNRDTKPDRPDMVATASITC